MKGNAYDCAPLNIQLQQTHKKIMGLKWLGGRGEKDQLILNLKVDRDDDSRIGSGNWFQTKGAFTK